MNDGWPRLRTDLVMHPWQEETERFLLEDPRTGRAFTFKKREFTIINLLDGTASIETIAARNEVSLPVSSVSKFANRLDQLGLLDRDNDMLEPSEAGLQILKNGQTDFSLERWAIPLRFASRIFFSRTLGLLLFSIMFLALLSEIIFWREAYARDLQLYFSWSDVWGTFAVIYLCLPAVLFIHELGHVLSSLSFTGNIHPMRVFHWRLKASVILPPVTIWRIQGRHRRIIIALSGLYFQTWLLVLILALWKSIGMKGIIGQICIGTSIPLIGGFVINLIPALPALAGRKTDGYFAMNYLLDLPNLSIRAQEFRAWILNKDRTVRSPAWLARCTPFQKQLLAFYTFVAPWLSLMILALIFWLSSTKIFLPIPMTGIFVTAIIALWIVTPYLFLGIRKIMSLIKVVSGKTLETVS